MSKFVKFYDGGGGGGGEQGHRNPGVPRSNERSPRNVKKFGKHCRAGAIYATAAVSADEGLPETIYELSRRAHNISDGYYVFHISYLPHYVRK